MNLRLYEKLLAEFQGNNFGAECVEWGYARNSDGYGVVKHEGKYYRVHRLSLEHKLGRPLQKGMVACHTCDNPPCYNPNHLFEGTLSDNLNDAYSKGRIKQNTRAYRLSVPKKAFEIIESMRILGWSPIIIAETFGISYNRVKQLTSHIDMKKCEQLSKEEEDESYN